jgi:phenylalanyl-tRNA synthetase alpha chain
MCGPSSFVRKHIHYSVKKGTNFSTEVKQLETDLTEDMLVSYVPARLLWNGPHGTESELIS